MKKKLVKLLKAAGVEFPAEADAPALLALAKERGLDTSAIEKPEDPEKPEDSEVPEGSPIEQEAAAQVEAMKPAPAAGFSEADIAAKRAAGLSREQAIEVLKTQAAHDARLAEAGE